MPSLNLGECCDQNEHFKIQITALCSIFSGDRVQQNAKSNVDDIIIDNKSQGRKITDPFIKSLIFVQMDLVTKKGGLSLDG